MVPLRWSATTGVRSRMDTGSSRPYVQRPLERYKATVAQVKTAQGGSWYGAHADAGALLVYTSSVIIHWNELDSGTYEDMTAVLLSRLHPDSQRIDGSGGDGGRDVQFEDTTGLRTWELKSFSDRIGPVQRRQIKKSLLKAAQLNPVDWALLVPVNPTPAELNWFRRLQKTVSFPIIWRGKTWLESKIADHESVARYFVEGRADEVLRMVHDLRLDGAMVRTVTEGAQRVVAVARQLEEIQPYYAVDIATRGPEVTITLQPAYRGAEIDRPIVARIETAFPDTDLGRVRQSQFAVAMDFGDSVSLEPEFVRQLEVDAPHGLGGRFTNVAVTISGREDLSLNTQFECADTDGRMRASLPFHIDKRSRGARGVAMYGSDASGVVSTSIRFAPQSLTGTISFAYHPPANALPGTLSAPTRFLASMTAPGVLRIRFEGDLPPLDLPLPAGSDVLVPPRYRDLIEALCTLQQRTGLTFPVPKELTNHDALAVESAIRLLRGETVAMPWSSLSIGVDGTFDALQTFPAALAMELPDYEIEVGGHRVRLGGARLYSPRIDLADRTDIERRIAKGRLDRVTLVPMSGSEFHLQLMRDAAPSEVP